MDPHKNENITYTLLMLYINYIITVIFLHELLPSIFGVVNYITI